MSEVILSFDVKLHKYTDNTGSVYTSVTQFISKFEPKFDELYWAKYKANERGVPVEQILSEWDTIRRNSQDRGNTTHEFLEDSVNDLYTTSSIEFKDIIKQTGTNSFLYKISSEKEMYLSPLREKIPIIFYKLVGYIREGYVLYAEKRVHSQKYKIAGTIDLLLIRGKEFIIVDWKTNKEDMKFESGYYKKEWGVVDGKQMKIKTNQFIRTKEYLDFPLNNLPKCKGSTYSLQLSLYAFLVEQYDFHNKRLELFHIIDNDYNDVKLHKIEYLKNDVIRALDFNQTQIKKSKFGIQ